MKPRNNKIGGCRVGAVPPDAKRRKVGRSAAKPLPPKVDLRPYLTSVEEQVGNSCVANACAGAYEYLAKRTLGDAADVSRLFIYYNARLEDDDVEQDEGTSMQSAIEGLKKYGACREDLWPNDEDSIIAEPAEEAYQHGAYFKIAEAEYVETDLDLYRHTLADGYPIAFCLNTFTSFDHATDNRGRVPMPRTSEQEREEHGWHAMLCVGYLDKDKMFIVRNSWGNEWGDKGYCYIPYKYVIHSDWNGHDTWIIKSVEDLDFAQEIESEDDSSYFAEDGSVQLFDFYVATDDVEGFATALEQLCEEYATDEEFYFDYEETEEEGVTYAEISNFDIALEDPEGFLEELDDLCNEWAEDENYDFSVEGYEESGEEETEEEGGEEVEALTLSGFYIYTERGEKVVERIDKLCAKHTTESDYYSFEWSEDADDDGTYIEFSTFEIIPNDEDVFLEELEALCEKLADESGYNWE
ncbi:MAG TPA: C1 family peptidase [Candidatus Thiothrix moscowensis]|uniref:C1 family peptidase n=1 Tax=unclassified Thiothrix TaxID=2636184 RepID=UPI0025FE82C9|nr:MULTISPECIES: C1 family peptidase [unclassified Thiothrix]HRJ52436.1 C1 family peptidase [Candidatus Thiothrix moscowensis]HRJ93378.1 C1 family peptidase [Candidatus Thiothrix moscowensis]